MPNQSVIVLDFGGQYNQLIARRVRECNVYCEVKPHTMSVDEIRAFDPIGIIFTGGPQSVYAEGSPQVDPEIFQLGIPILGICYGCQLMHRKCIYIYIAITNACGYIFSICQSIGATPCLCKNSFA